MDDSTTSDGRRRPRDLLEEMAKGFFRGKVLCAAVQLGVPDALGDGERSVDELAAATGTHAPSLHRLLRALASIGVTVETAPARFVLTALGEPLRRDVPGTVRATVEFWADLMADRWTYLADCVRSGSLMGAVQAMERDGVKSRMAINPQAARSLFHGCFAESAAEDHDCFVAAYDFSGCRVVADLGGGGGALLASILSAHPRIRGVLVDREGAIEGAAARMRAAGIRDRCELVVGDLMQAVPEGADTYVMKHVLHIFEDDKALRILANCRKVMAATDRMLVLEHVLPSQVQQADQVVENALMLDMNMLAVTGGGERSEAAWRALLRSGGFELSRIVAAEGTTVRVIEAIPVQ
jgi:hypothetical protein